MLLIFVILVLLIIEAHLNLIYIKSLNDDLERMNNRMQKIDMERRAAKRQQEKEKGTNKQSPAQFAEGYPVFEVEQDDLARRMKELENMIG